MPLLVSLVEPSPIPAEPRSIAEFAEYLTELGGALMSAGCPTARLEALLSEIGEAEGFEVEAFATPTGLFLSVSDRQHGKTPVLRMLRVKSWSTRLDRLSDVDEVVTDVAARRTSLSQALHKLRELPFRPPQYPAWARWLASGLTTGAVSVFFRGQGADLLFASLGGFLLAAVNLIIRPNPELRFLDNFLGGVLAAAVAWGASAAWPALVSRQVVVLAIVVLLVPGMTLTTGLAELTRKNLVSGSARLMDATMVLLSLLFGVALVFGVERQLGLVVPKAPFRAGYPLWGQLAALLVVALCFGIQLGVPRRYLLTSIGSSAIGWGATAVASSPTGPPALAAFVASFSVAALANFLSRVTRRPSQIFLLPGLSLLVPGTVGFRSLDTFLQGEWASGAAQGLLTFLTAGALVTGLLLANGILPPRKIL